jgi:hypothetical protein
MRILIVALSVLPLAACMQSGADTQRGVGFGNYDLYMQQRAYMAGNPSQAPAPVDIAASSSAAPQPVQVVTASALPPQDAGAPLSAFGTNPALSPEVASLPERPAGDSANIAAFALSTSHPIGQEVYRRVGAGGSNLAERACARFPSDTEAQQAFLEAGGPERDRLGLDPDGDGYACRWDPAAFRLARG